MEWNCIQFKCSLRIKLKNVISFSKFHVVPHVAEKSLEDRIRLDSIAVKLLLWRSGVFLTTVQLNLTFRANYSVSAHLLLITSMRS